MASPEGVGFSDGEKAFFGRADCVRASAGCLGHGSGRDHPEARDQRADLCRWKKRFAGLGIAELRRLRTLEEENRKLKQLVADLSLDKKMLQDVLSKKL